LEKVEVVGGGGGEVVGGGGGEVVEEGELIIIRLLWLRRTEGVRWV
jgi:hypothetical protein